MRVPRVARRPGLPRLPFSALTRLEAEGSQAVVLSTTQVTRMKVNCEDAPYATDKVGPGDLSGCLLTHLHHFSISVASDPTTFTTIERERAWLHMRIESCMSRHTRAHDRAASFIS
jgi:hypothetical protein